MFGYHRRHGNLPFVSTLLNMTIDLAVSQFLLDPKILLLHCGKQLNRMKNLYVDPQ